MRKLFITLLLFCMSASIYAVDWVEVGAAEGTRRYIDIDSIEDVNIDGNAYKSAWIKFVLEEPADFLGQEIGHSLAHVIFSCQDKTSAFASTMLYDPKGNLVHQSDRNYSNLNFQYLPETQPSLVCERSKEEIKVISTQKNEEQQESTE